MEIKPTDLSKWMGDLPEFARCAPLSELSIPGSHDSFTYSLAKSGSAGPDQPDCIRSLTRRFPVTSANILYRWSRTQECGVKDQLKGGVRYLDIRLDVVIGNYGEREIRIIHCLLGSKIQDLLLEIKLFLSENPTELIILDFQHLYQFEVEDHLNLVIYILDQFHGQLCPWNLKGISLSMLKSLDLNLILIYPALHYHHLLAPDISSLFWPRQLCPNPWANTTSTRKLVPFLDRGLDTRRSDLLFVSQAILTPSVATVFLHPLSGLYQTCAKKCNKSVLDWIERRMVDVTSRPNIVIIDFLFTCINTKQIVEHIVKFNTIKKG